MLTAKNEDCCKICGESLPTAGKDHFVICEQCGTMNRIAGYNSPEISMAFALTALILYIPANIFPFMTLEIYGNKNTATIWEGIVTMSDTGSWGIAAIIFLASMVIPLVKLLILFYLGFTAKSASRRKFRTRLYNTVEAIGRWSMLDIYLLAVLVAIMKMGPWAHAEPGLGSWMFALVVIFTMISSAYFDPSTIWNDTHDEKS